MRVLQSFPHNIGAGRICETAWYQAAGAAAAGADVLVIANSVHRPLPPGIAVRTTLARGKLRVPWRLLGGDRSLKLHDRLVARMLPRLAGEIDIVHVWPRGALETLRQAARLGIPTVMERPNAHTRFAYEAVQAECDRIGVHLPPDHEHAYNAKILAREEEEYALADRLLCPSDFVVQTFLDQGTQPARLVRHTYGYDEARFHPPRAMPARGDGLTAVFVGVCAVRKGLHFALEAWLRSEASKRGTFLIAGEFLPEYEVKLRGLLAHPSIKVLGHRNDVPELMRQADVMVLPSIEEGFGLVCVEALACGCVPLVSDACTEICRDHDNALVHRVGDVGALAAQFDALHADRDLLERLREGCLRTAPGCSWTAAGFRLVEAYAEVVESCRHEQDEQIGATAQTPRSCAGSAQA